MDLKIFFTRPLHIQYSVNRLVSFSYGMTCENIPQNIFRWLDASTSLSVCIPPQNECFVGNTGISLSVHVSVCVRNTSNFEIFLIFELKTLRLQIYTFFNKYRFLTLSQTIPGVYLSAV